MDEISRQGDVWIPFRLDSGAFIENPEDMIYWVSHWNVGMNLILVNGSNEQKNVSSLSPLRKVLFYQRSYYLSNRIEKQHAGFQ